MPLLFRKACFKFLEGKL